MKKNFSLQKEKNKQLDKLSKLFIEAAISNCQILKQKLLNDDLQIKEEDLQNKEVFDFLGEELTLGKMKFAMRVAINSQKSEVFAYILNPAYFEELALIHTGVTTLKKAQ